MVGKNTSLNIGKNKMAKMQQKARIYIGSGFIYNNYICISQIMSRRGFIDES